ncbi:MAG: IS1380 family transposase [Dermatophilaceae bacterium]
MKSVRRRRGKAARRRQRVFRRARFAAADPSVTGCAGVLALAELVDLLGVVGHLDEGIGPIKTRDRGVSGGGLLVALGQAQLAGADYLSGMDTHRRDVGVAHLGAAPVPASTTAGGLARRFTSEHVAGIEAGWGRVIAAAFERLPEARRAQLLAGPVTIDLDSTDVEVHGSKKQQVGWTHAGVRAGRPHAASWAETALVLAGDLLAGDQDVRPHAADLLGRAVANLPAEVRAGQGRVRVRADAGYFTGELAKAAADAGIDFAIAAKRMHVLWSATAALAGGWVPAEGMPSAQVAVLDYAPHGWPAGTYTIVRRVWTPAEALSTSTGSRRRRTFGPDQLALQLGTTTEGRYAYSFIVTNIPTGGADFPSITAVESWFRARADIENVIRDTKHGAGLNHLPSGHHRVNTIWMWAAFTAVNLGVLLQALTGMDHTARTRTLTLRRTLIAVPARIIRHARSLTIRPAPGHQLLADLVTRLRALRT